jgi:hypothetical protein
MSALAADIAVPPIQNNVLSNENIHEKRWHVIRLEMTQPRYVNHMPIRAISNLNCGAVHSKHCPPIAPALLPEEGGT